jgi:prephenate dehydratase
VSTEAVTPRVAFQGERGAFSEEAAGQLLGAQLELVPCQTFESLFAAVTDGRADYALAPIENSLAGSVLKVYDLLLTNTLHIAGEVIMPIQHYLIGCPGAVFAEIKTVASHPVALAQCERFFAAHPHIQRIVAEDTAGSVAQIVRQGDRTRAAIAGRRAATIYGGTILRAHLEDHSANYTRFVLLTTVAAPSGDDDKLSLVVQLPPKTGALHRALAPFARRNIELLKIETRPVAGQPWQYHFFLDLQASVQDAEVVSALAELQTHASAVRLLGCYPSARRGASRTHAGAQA